jgi:hypothetical protein
MSRLNLWVIILVQVLVHLPHTGQPLGLLILLHPLLLNPCQFSPCLPAPVPTCTNILKLESLVDENTIDPSPKLHSDVDQLSNFPTCKNILKLESFVDENTFDPSPKPNSDVDQLSKFSKVYLSKSKSNHISLSCPWALLSSSQTSLKKVYLSKSKSTHLNLVRHWYIPLHPLLFSPCQLPPCWRVMMASSQTSLNGCSVDLISKGF